MTTDKSQILAAQAFARANGLPVPDGIIGRFHVPPGPVTVIVVPSKPRLFA
jgi:hypothetical protein